MIAAVFDLDGTLYTGHIWRGIAEHHRTQRVKRMQLFWYVGTHLTMWPLWRLGLIPETTVREMWAQHMGWTVRGWTPQEGETAFNWITDRYVLPLVRPDVLARLKEHQDAGRRVILVSGTPSPLLAEIGRRWGVTETVGTPLILKNGRYSGKSELPVCQGIGKATRLKAHLGDHAPILSASYAYADSFTDIPLLEQVGHPVAVYPDERLADHAREQGWEIISDRERSS